MENCIIKIDNLSKVYRLYEKPIDRMFEALSISKKIHHTDHYALDQVTFEIKKGEIVGFVGKNGAGKSTLLKIITGLLTPSCGDAKVKGSISALLELGTGFNPEYSGIENIYLYGTMLGKTREEVEKEVPEVIQFADIGDFINQPVKTYSSGMFARLAFSVAINVKPDILIVDEILAVGDLDFQLKCMNKMKEMMRGGTTVLFVSHDINSIKRFCTRAIWLKDGCLMEDGDVNSVTDHYLDYLKVESLERQSNKVKDEVLDETNDCEEAKDLTLTDMGVELFKAEIKCLNIRGHVDEETIIITRDEPLIIELEYEVFDQNVDHPVIGIAVRRIDDVYMCGLNTLLDEMKIPWKLGINKICLSYQLGTLLMGGKYYFDAAIFDETATVPIQYISRIKEFEISDGYRAEGIYVIPHKWDCEDLL